METVTTDHSGYPPGSLVQISGSGYGPGCDVVVKVTRPDGLVVTGDGSLTPGSDTVTTDPFGNFTYDYQLQGIPAVEGTYNVDVLGDLDAVFAHTSFEDAVTLRLYTNTARTNEDYQLQLGDAVYAQGAGLAAGNSYKFEVKNPAGVSKAISSTCSTGVTTLNDTLNFVPDTISGSSRWTYILHEYTGTTCAGAPKDVTQSFDVAQATAYTTSALTTTTTAYPAAATAFVVVNGLEPNLANWNASWVASGVNCANTGGGDRPDADANGGLPGSYLAYPPSNAFADPWNKLSNYETTTCPAFAAGNAGQWKLNLTQTAGGHTYDVTLNVFSVDTAPPTVTINQAGTQSDPSTASTIHFTAVFSEPVTGFTGSDVSFTGSTSGGTKSAAVTEIAPNNGTTYDVAVTGMTSRGSVVASIPAGGAQDAAGNNSTASTSTDNSVTWDRVPAATAPTFSPGAPKTSDTVQASTTTSDPDGDTISVAWVWKVNRGGDICTVKTESSASAAAGSRSVSLNLSADYHPSASDCTGAQINPLNPSKNDIVTVSATPNDGLFDGSSQSNNVTIANSAPTVSLTGGNPLSANEGDTKTYNFTAADADGDALTFAAGYPSCGTNGSVVGSPTVSGGSFQCKFPDGDAGSTVAVKVKDSDNAVSNEDTQSVTIHNVPPSITISGAANVAEGSSYSLTLGAVSDPGSDTVTSYVVHWGDGTSNTYASNGVKSHAYADGPNDYNVTVDLVDEDGTYLNAANPLSVHVNNVPPSIAISGNASVNEGSSYSLTLGAVTDPGQDTVSSYVVHWGDGSSNSYGSNGIKTHTYADGPNDYNVTVDLTDEDGIFSNAANPLSVHVNNVAPSIAISGAANVAEGSSYSLTLGAVSDPGSDTVTSYVVHWGDGNSNTYASNGVKSHTYADGPNDHNVTVDLVDEDGTYLNAANAFSVHVNNVAPSVSYTTSPATASEGQDKSYTFAVSDPGDDTFAASSGKPDCGSGGTFVSGSYSLSANTGSATGSFACHFPDGEADSDVTISFTDSDGATGNTATQSVHVNNVAPTIVISGNAYVNEGSSYSLTLGAVSDPGQDTVSSYVVHWGDGSSNTYASNGVKTHTYADGPNDYNVTVDLVDEDGTFSNAANAVSVHVNNVPPTVAFTSAPASANEGQSKHYTYSISDPGQDTVQSVATSCGANGNKSNAANSDSAGSFDCTFPDGDASSTVSVQATDSDGDSGNTASQPVAIHNVAPTIAISGNASVDEGSSYSLNLGTITDPGADTVTQWVVHWGDGSSNTYASAGAKTHIYADGPSDHAITVDLTDEDGTFANAANPFSVHVDNVAPTVSLDPGNTLTWSESTIAARTFNYSTFDPAGANDPLTVTIDCGSGSSYVAGSDTGTSFKCVFADGPASPSVKVSADDGDSGVGSDHQDVTVQNVDPTVTLAATNTYTFDESGTAERSFDYSVFDPAGANDPIAIDSTSCGAVPNSVASNSFNSSTNQGTLKCKFPDGPDAPSISIDVSDGDGGTGSASHVVTVNNVAPTADLTGPANVDEGSTHTYNFTVSDPGLDAFSVNSSYPDCGTGGQYVANTLSTDASGGSFDCFFPNGPATTSVKIKVTDSDGASTTDSESVQVVQVANVPPVVTAPADQSSNEGSSHSFDLGSFSDPGADSPWHVSVDWGDSSSATTFDAASPGTIAAHSHTYADGPNDYTVTVTVDDGTDPRSNTFKVHVDNVAPTVAFTSAPASANEGQSKHYTYSISDPGQDTVQSVATSCGANGTKSNAANSDSAGSFDCTFPDGDASATVSVQATDSDGEAGNTASQPVTIHNVAPTIAIGGASYVNEGSSYSLTLGAVTDPGQDTVSSYVVHWGDGSSNTYTSNGAKTHTYADGPNDYPITVDLIDEDGTFANAANAFSVHVDNVDPVVSLSGATSTTEGTTETYSYTFTDPGADTWTHLASCGAHGVKSDDSFDASTKSGSFKCTWPDNYSAESVSAKVTDKDSGFGTDSKSVDIANVAPTVSLSGATSANEGDTKHYTYSWSDPGSADTFPSHSIDCGIHGHASNEVYDASTNSGSFDCTWSDDSGSGTADVAASVSDDDGGTGNDTKHVTVANVAPTAQVTGPANVDEGSTHTYTFTVSDAGSDDTFTVASGYPSCGTGGQYVPGSLAVTAHGGSFDCFFPDGPATTDVKIKVTDDDGASDTGDESVQVVQVANVDPSITAAGNQSSDEGENHSFSLGSFSDPGPDSPWSVSVDWGDGSPATTFQVTAGGAVSGQSLGTKPHTYADGPNDHAVKVTVTDKNGGSDTKSFSVHVNNVAPTIAISGNANVNEGSSYSLTLGAVTDPGQDTVSSYVVHWGDGSSDTYTSAGAKSHTYADGPNTYAIKVDLVDEDDTFSDAANAQSVQVDNVAPTIAISGNAYVDEGSSYSVNLGAVTDPGTDTVSSYVVHWGDGNTDTYTSGGAKTHTYADGPNDYPITVDLTDEDGTFTNAANAFSVHINNVAPTAHVSGPSPVDEGTTDTYTFTVSDPGDDTFGVNSGYPQCGTGGQYVSGSLAVDAHGGSFKCFFPDGPASTNVAIKVSDSDGASDTASESVQIVNVANVNPTVSGPADQASNEGASHSFDLGSFSDPGPDSPWTVSVDWGDASPPTSFQVTAAGAVTNQSLGSQSHAYAQDGTYNVTVTVTDTNGGPGQASFKANVANVAPAVSLSGPSATSEGATESYSYTFTDPGADTWTHVASCGAHGSVSADSFDQSTKSGSFNCTWPDNYVGESVSATVNDDDTFGSDSKSVDIANVKPNVTLTGVTSANEGDTKHYSYSWTDPGSADTFPSHSVDCGSHGSASNQVFDGSAETGSFDCTWSDDSGTGTADVSAGVTDDNGGTGSDTKHVTVANQPPSTPSLVSPADNATTNSNKPAFDWSNSSDPAGANDTITYRIQVDDNCDFSSPEIDQTTSSSDFAPATALADGTYCWRVDASDEDGGTSAYSTVRHVTIDATSPDATINQASTQVDPTNGSPIHFSVHFTEPVSDFATGDVALSGTAGATTAAVSGSGQDYDVAVSGMGGDGTVIATITSGMAHDGAGNGNNASSSSDNTVTYDTTRPNVSMNQASGQADPTNASPIHFTAVFSECVSGFDASDVTISGTAGGTKSITVTDSGDHKTYDVAVSGMTADGTVIASIPAGGAIDRASNPNNASTSTDNTVTWKGSKPSVTINQAVGQNDPTKASPVNFTATFSEPVSGFDGNDVTLNGTAGATTAVVTGGPTVYNVAVSGMTSDGSVTASIAANDATDSVGNGNTASTSSDNTVAYDTHGPVTSGMGISPTPASSPPTVTAAEMDGLSNVAAAEYFIDSVGADGSGTPMSASDGSFSSGAENVTGTLTTAQFSALTQGSHTVYVHGKDNAGNWGATQSITFVKDTVAPTVTVNQASATDPFAVDQQDPTSSSVIHFTAIFSEAVTPTSSWNGMVTLSGPAASGAIANVYNPSGDRKTFDIKVTVTTAGAVSASIPASRATDDAGNANAASTSTDNTVTYQPSGGTAPTVVIDSPTFGSVYAKGAVSINPLTLSAHFSDPDNGPWKWLINWDDNGATSSGTVSGTSTTNSPFSATHAFTNPGVYTINVKVTDGNGTGLAGTASVWIVVYDPNGGYVTGGGWLNVAPGSYRADPTLSGRANFGFNSQYKKNATVPTGETEFNFQVGNFNFHASLYQWLVVNGFKAQYKGTGTVNGAGSYDFTLTAYDGDLMNPVGPDKFRIRITDNNNSNAVVFDNRYGTPTDIDTADPAAIAGGSIVIHKA